MPTNIEWTDETWNPIRGCSRVSEGCRHCYAERVAGRFNKPGQAYEGLAIIKSDGAHWTGEVRFIEEKLLEPLSWREPRMVFANSMSDMFHEKLAVDYIARIFAVMGLAWWHTFQVLTKRSDLMCNVLSDRHFWVMVADYMEKMLGGSQRNAPATVPPCNSRPPHVTEIIERLRAGTMNALPNVWLLVSVEDQDTANQRIENLIRTPAAVRGISAEPLLGPMDISPFITHWKCVGCGTKVFTSQIDLEEQACGCGVGRGRWGVENGGPNGLHWVIVGGESGPGARPMYQDWPRKLRDQCLAAGVPFFFKQWGEWGPNYEVVVGKTIEKRQLSDGHVMRQGKKAAGRILDGKEYSQYPEVHA